VTKSAITHLVTTWGINVFRIPVYLETSDSGYLSDPAYFDTYVQNVVEWCRELGIYVIIDFHVLSKGDPNEYLDSKGGSTGVAIDFWTKYASLYKDESHVLYEIANEPNNIDWPSVLSYHNSVIGAIRAIDSETIIIAGTTSWSQDIHLAAATPVSQPHNVMYTFHFYAATHGFLYDRVASYINTLPIFVSEWGISAANGNGGYDTAVAQKYLDLFADIDSTILSWTLWSWSDKAETSAILESSSSCSSEAWTAVTCPSQFVENYFKSEDYSLMIACNSSGYVPASEDEATPFVEEHQWLFWTLGALALIGILFVAYRKKESSGASFTPVAKAPPGNTPFDYESNPYSAKSSSSQQAQPPPSSSSSLSPSRNNNQRQSQRPEQGQRQGQGQRQEVATPLPSASNSNSNSPPPPPSSSSSAAAAAGSPKNQGQPQASKSSPPRPRPGQRRQKPSTANSRRREQQMQNMKR
jgi:hypothetical protein